MQTNQILTQNNTKYTRRDAIGRFMATLAAIVAPPVVKPSPPVEGCECPHCAPDLWQEVEAKPYPDPERTAAIDAARAELDQAITRLEIFWAWLGSARTLPPAEVDGQAFLQHVLDLDEVAYQLERLVNNSAFTETLGEQLTGADMWPQFIEYSITTGLFTQNDARREIAFQREKRPAVYEHLARLYTEKWGVAL